MLYLVAQSCPALCDPMDCSPRFFCPWGFSGQEYWSGLPCLSPGNLPNPAIELRSPTEQADSSPSEPPGKPKNMEVGSLSLLQGIFPTQELNQGFLHCRWILYLLDYVRLWCRFYVSGKSKSRNHFRWLWVILGIVLKTWVVSQSHWREYKNSCSPWGSQRVRHNLMTEHQQSNKLLNQNKEIVYSEDNDYPVVAVWSLFVHLTWAQHPM